MAACPSSLLQDRRSALQCPTTYVPRPSCRLTETKRAQRRAQCPPLPKAFPSDIPTDTYTMFGESWARIQQRNAQANFKPEPVRLPGTPRTLAPDMSYYRTPAQAQQKTLLLNTSVPVLGNHDIFDPSYNHNAGVNFHIDVNRLRRQAATDFASLKPFFEDPNVVTFFR